MSYPKNFIDFVDKCCEHEQFVGFGNPSSNVLIIGKETSTNPDSDDPLEKQNAESLKNNPHEWKENIKKNTSIKDIEPWKFDKNLPLSEIDNNPLFPWKGTLKKDTSSTWKKYQKLHDVIHLNGINRNNYLKVNFLNDFFITEMNHVPSRNTIHAKRKKDFRKNLEYRKHNIIDSNFLKQFPVVVLACLDYIKPNEIYNIFECHFDGKEEGKKCFGKGNWFCTHHTESKNKLIIHTRQLSTSVKDVMLEELGHHIRKHLEYLGR